MPVGSHGFTVGSPQRRVESGHRLREIVQHPRAVESRVCFYRFRWSCRYHSPALFCFPDKTKILVDVSGRAYILRRKLLCYSCVGITRRILFTVENRDERTTFCELSCCTSKVGERILPSKQVGSGVERHLIGRTDGLMPAASRGGLLRHFPRNAVLLTSKCRLQTLSLLWGWSSSHDESRGMASRASGRTSPHADGGRAPDQRDRAWC
jgi:hypothetical protein